MKTVAVMQPYFMPYAGYFRLLDQADHFVVFDCVQFPRRGRVHRCEMRHVRAGTRWLTLPIAPCAQDSRIDELAFAPGAVAEWAGRLGRHGVTEARVRAAIPDLASWLFGPLDRPVDFLVRGLRHMADLFGIEVEISRSSDLDLPRSLQAQSRILEIVGRLSGTHYINAPGGRALYDDAAFSAAGVELCFLPAYTGTYFNLLEDVLEFGPDIVGGDIRTGRAR